MSAEVFPGTTYKDLAKKERPAEPGWYLWWMNEKASRPCVYLAEVFNSKSGLVAKFSGMQMTTESLVCTIDSDRLWLKVAER